MGKKKPVSFCVRGGQKETQKKTLEGVTQGSLMMSHALRLHTFYLQNSQPAFLLSERVLGFLLCSCKKESCSLLAASWFCTVFVTLLCFCSPRFTSLDKILSNSPTSAEIFAFRGFIIYETHGIFINYIN